MATMEEAWKAFEEAERQEKAANDALDKAKTLITTVAEKLREPNGWSQLRFTNHVRAEPPGNVAMQDEDTTVSLESWPSLNELQELLRRQRQASAALRAARDALPPALRDRLSPAPRRSR